MSVPDLKSLVARMIASGVAPDEAGAVAAEIYAAGRVQGIALGSGFDLAITGADGMVTLNRDGISLSIPSRDAVWVAREMLESAGYGWVQFYRYTKGFGNIDLEDDDPPDVDLRELRIAAPAAIQLEMLGGAS
jgi:hypothetical protein